jgi:CheY-like chemotaxis protein
VLAPQPLARFTTSRLPERRPPFALHSSYAPELRAVVAGGLEARGYTVITARDGVEALELLARDDAAEIELLLSDVVMPRMGGPELAARVREQRPSLPVILVSGHTAQAVEHVASDPTLVFLAKPSSATMPRAEREPSEPVRRAFRQLASRPPTAGCLRGDRPPNQGSTRPGSCACRRVF